MADTPHNAWIEGFLACLCLMTGRHAEYEELRDAYLARRGGTDG